MKRLPPETLSGKFQYFVKNNWLRILSLVVWLGTVGMIAKVWSVQPTPEQLSTVCVVSESVQKNELLSSDQVSTKQMATRFLPANAINDCSNAQLYKIPVLTDLQAGDVLQLSAFEKPEELTSLKDQLTQKQKLFYLPVKDLHAIPTPLEPGIELTILGKAKKDENATVLIESVKVADLSVIKNDDDQEQISSIGFALDQDTSLQLTKALADGWFLVAVTK